MHVHEENHHQQLLEDENHHHFDIENLQRQQEVEQYSAYAMSNWDGDELDPGKQAYTHAHHAQPAARDLIPEEETQNAFIESYLKSIQPARDIIRGQWSECRDNNYLNNEELATFNEVDALHFQ